MKIRRRTFIGGALALPIAAIAGRAWTQTNARPPAILFDVGGKLDRSFNQAAFDGAERFRKETGVQYLEFEATAPAERDKGIGLLARQSPSVLIAVGFFNRPAMRAAARDFPAVKFVLVDRELKAPNVQSILFREHEGSFLVGMLAALASRTRKIGFIGGVDIPPIRKFARGYAQGAAHVDARIELLQDTIGTTSAAWNDPARGREIARGQIARGADVIFAAAGATGTGVYEACRDAGKYAIGVDSNQNALFPGTMLTSMVKRVDLVVYESMLAASKGTLGSGVRSLGLRENGVGWALDEHNRRLVTPEMEQRVNAARDNIISGKIVVSDAAKP